MGLSLRGTTSGAVDINAPAVAGDNTITLPNGNGSANQFFKNSDTAGIITHSSMTESSSGVISIGDIDIDGTTRTITTGVGQTVGFSTDIEVQGSVSISNGNLVLTSGSGIDFSATADGSGTTTSELLDDYEEGTWTPVVGETSNVITLVGGNQQFRYQKVGNMVTVTFSIDDVTTSGTTGGAFIIGGLPYVSSSVTNLRTIGTPAVYYGSGLRASNWPSMVHVGSNTTRTEIYYKLSASSNYDRDTVNSVGADSYFFWQVTYMVD